MENVTPNYDLLFSQDPFIKVMAFRKGVGSIPVGGNGPSIGAWNSAQGEDPD